MFIFLLQRKCAQFCHPKFTFFNSFEFHKSTDVPTALVGAKIRRKETDIDWIAFAFTDNVRNYYFLFLFKEIA